jgi:hypothetical protein
MGFVLAFFQHLKTIVVSQTEIIHLSDTKQTTFFWEGLLLFLVKNVTAFYGYRQLFFF